MELLLESWGYRTIIAFNGDDLLSKLQAVNNDPAVIISSSPNHYWKHRSRGQNSDTGSRLTLAIQTGRASKTTCLYTLSDHKNRCLTPVHQKSQTKV